MLNRRINNNKSLFQNQMNNAHQANEGFPLDIAAAD